MGARTLQLVTCCVTALAMGAAASAQGLEVGAPAPDFALEALDGARTTLSDFAGHPVLLNFWASWCKPCRAEMPEIVAAYRERVETGLEVLAVNSTDQEQRKDVRRFVDEIGMPFKVLLDAKGRVRERYRLAELPTSIFVDRGGVVRVIHAGPMSREALGEGLAEIVREP